MQLGEGEGIHFFTPSSLLKVGSIHLPMYPHTQLCQQNGRMVQEQPKTERQECIKSAFHSKKSKATQPGSIRIFSVYYWRKLVYDKSSVTIILYEITKKTYLPRQKTLVDKKKNQGNTSGNSYKSTSHPRHNFVNKLSDVVQYVSSILFLVYLFQMNYLAVFTVLWYVKIDKDVNSSLTTLCY